VAKGHVAIFHGRQNFRQVNLFLSLGEIFFGLAIQKLNSQYLIKLLYRKL